MDTRSREERHLRSFYCADTCQLYRDLGMRSFDLLGSYSLYRDFKAGKPFSGGVELVESTEIPMCDVYRHVPEAPGWIMVAFQPQAGPGAKVIAQTKTNEDQNVALLALGPRAWVKHTFLVGLNQIHSTWQLIEEGAPSLPSPSPGEAMIAEVERGFSKPDLVITEFPAVGKYLIDKGYAKPDAKVAEEVYVDDLRGKHVIGDLPVSFAQYASAFSLLVMNWTLLNGSKRVKYKDVETCLVEIKRISIYDIGQVPRIA